MSPGSHYALLTSTASVEVKASFETSAFSAFKAGMIVSVSSSLSHMKFTSTRTAKQLVGIYKASRRSLTSLSVQPIRRGSIYDLTQQFHAYMHLLSAIIHAGSVLEQTFVANVILFRRKKLSQRFDDVQQRRFASRDSCSHISTCSIQKASAVQDEPETMLSISLSLPEAIHVRTDRSICTMIGLACCKTTRC